MENLVRSRGITKGKITSFKNYIARTIAAHPDLSILLEETKRLEVRKCIIRIRETYDKYDQIQTDIDQLTNDEQETIGYREQVEENYFQSIGLAESLIRRVRRW